MSVMYGFSMDEEMFDGDFDTREGAVAEANQLAIDMEVGGFFTGRCVPYVPLIDAHGVLEGLGEDAWDVVGEVADGWLRSVPIDQIEDLTQRLNATFAQWANETGNLPHFATVVDVEEHAVEPVDDTLICSSGKLCPRGSDACMVAGHCVGRPS